MTSEPAAGDRVVLVIDLDGELLAPLAALTEVLLALRQWEEDDHADPPERDPLWLPPPLAGGEALAAVQRLYAALRSTQSLGPEHGRLLARDGSREHLPLTPATLLAADVQTLSATAQVLGHPGLDSTIADLVEDFARSLYGDPHASQRTERPALVGPVASLAGLLDLAPTDDTQLLIARLAANRADLDLALTDAEEAAYGRYADRMNRMWTNGNGTPRFAR